MKAHEPSTAPPHRALSEEDRIHIAAVFQEKMVPRLILMDARIGNINCAFAGERYTYWNLQFRSVRSGFDVVDFEYDEHSRDLDLPAAPRTVQIIDHV